MNARQYQITQIETGIEEVSEYRKILMQLPTGGGKTVEFSLIVKRFIANTTKSVLILVHRKELMAQAAKTIKEITGINPTLITSKTRKYSLSRVYIGMVESTIPRLHMIGNPIGLVIIDECHIQNFNKMHNVFLDELIIGYTATPISASKKEPLNKFYRKIVVGPQISELIKDGYLAQNITRCPKEVVDATKFEVDRLKGDYNESKMAAEYKKPKHVTNVIANYHKHCKGKKTIVFNVNIEHSLEVTDCFQHCGFNARHLDSSSDKRPSIREGFENERDEILDWFKITPDAILCNVMIATVGFDEPTILNVILNFSTLSIVKFIQCAGRGGRIIDDFFIQKYQEFYPYKLEKKTQFNIIDMGGNCIKFGDWNEDRDWEYIFNNPEKPGEGVAPVKVCPECDGLVAASARICTCSTKEGEMCLYEFEKKKVEEEKKAGELIIITKGFNIPELIEKNSHKHDYYLFYKMGEDIVNDLFRLHKEPSFTLVNRAFEAYYDLCIDWWKKSMAGKDGYVKDITNSASHIKKARNYFNTLLKKRQLSLDFDENLLIIDAKN